MLLGAHCSTAGGVHQALIRARKIGAESCQVFVKNNMQWLGKPFPASALKLFREELARGGPRCVFGHAGYLINLAAPPSSNRDRSIQSLIQEIELAASLGVPFLVLHPGSHLGSGETVGLDHAAAGLDEVFAATRQCPVQVALENTAGQGSCLGHKLEHLAAILERVSTPERIGICLDTAHLFAAGYDLRTSRGWNAVIGAAEQLLGLHRILAFHLNDSKTDLSSRVDRHAHIGQGKIGLGGFRHVVNDARFLHVPGCLETPKSQDLHEDLENLQALRSLLRAPRRTMPQS
jgi:deoxyribonuclease-4